MKRQHILLVDPIAYAGGSKIATVRMLEMLDTRNTRVTIVTRDPASWESLAAETSPLFELNLLAGKEQGTAYFLRHILIVFSLLWARLRFGRFDRALGASGPGIDLSLYLARRLFGYQVIQLIHGPVARSRTIGRALRAADRIFYLESTRQSLLRAMESVQPALASGPGLDNEKFIAFNNGLPADRWPSASEATETGIFWASSLLKWKGLATLIGSLKSLSVSLRPQTHICYIRPRDTRLELGPGPVEIERVHWYENPPNLDQIRASCNIFVSRVHSTVPL